MLKFNLTLFLALAACQPSPTTTHEKEEHRENEHVSDDPHREIAATRARLNVAKSLTSAVGESVRKIRISLVKQPPSSAGLEKADTAHMSIALSGNIHGERIDCGCRKNPLGGLARHQTIVEGIAKKNPSTLFVDAGDAFFKNVYDDVVQKKGETLALYNAASVAKARALMSMNVQNIGELDLVFGLDELQKLIAISKTPTISANLYKDGKRIFPPFLIQKVGGLNVAIVGLAKEKSRKRDFYKTRFIQSREPAAEFEKVLSQLPTVDLVVLLSNLGIPNTQKLVAKVSRRPDVVIVSNTNRLTKKTVFERGVPIVESGSRGKYLGQIDLLLNGKQVLFKNGGKSKLAKLDEFSRTYRNYLSSRIRYLRQIEKALQANLKEDAKHGAQAKQEEHHVHSSKTHVHNKDAQSFLKNATVLQKQMAALATTLVSQSASLDIENTNSGDDFFELTMVPVKLDIAEEKKIKGLISAREKKRPHVKKIKLPQR